MLLYYIIIMYILKIISSGNGQKWLEIADEIFS